MRAGVREKAGDSWVPGECGFFGLEPSHTFRSAMTMGNSLCAVDGKGRISTAENETEEAVRRTVAAHRSLRPHMAGEFHPLLPLDASEAAWRAGQFHRPDLGEGVAMTFRRNDGGSSPPRAGR